MFGKCCIQLVNHVIFAKRDNQSNRNTCGRTVQKIEGVLSANVAQMVIIRMKQQMNANRVLARLSLIITPTIVMFQLLKMIMIN